jgi:hypothetical protein
MATGGGPGAGAASDASPDTSVVEICQKKIQDALGATSVKVTGECCKIENGTLVQLQLHRLTILCSSSFCYHYNELIY